MKLSKILLAILAVTTIGMGMVGFSACNKGDEVSSESSIPDVVVPPEENEEIYSKGLILTAKIGEYEVAGIGSCEDNDVIIPSEYEGKPVTSIATKAFYNCQQLKSITIPENITKIGDSAFFGCNGLKNITLPKSLKNIGDKAFSCCKGLTNVEMVKGVETIGDEAFARCNVLTSIVIPNSVTKIGVYAFEGCQLLKDVTIGDGVTSIGEFAFYSCNSLTNITVDEKNKKYSSEDGNLYNKEKTELIQYAIGKTKTSFTIPKTVASIAEEAF
ncbi:MAG: leucine-rich repeat domain-containing protein, partial [Clostridiales bacterium]|nr:leucine-rich repeat domain-containing protein [Clostridiales bacterium]